MVNPLVPALDHRYLLYTQLTPQVNTVSREQMDDYVEQHKRQLASDK